MKTNIKTFASRLTLHASLLFLALCPLNFALAQQYGWTDISVNIPTEADLSDVFFVSYNEGWITSSSIADIYHTTDGGETFDIQTTQFSTEALSMIDANVGYSGGTSGRVYRTSNGGGDWTPIGFISSTLTDMDFANSTQGYACGNSGAVFSITPEGVTNLNSGLSTNLYGISAPTVDNVWVCGGSTISYFSGTSFEYQSGPVGSYNSIFFINDNEGWVVGNSGLIGHTEDGGEIWHSQINPDYHSLYDVFFLDENNGWAVGSQGSIIHTIDGGETWELQSQGLTTNFLRGVHFTSPTNGYVVGNGKTLLKYSEVSGIGDLNHNAGDIVLWPNPTRGKFQITSTKHQTNSNIQIQNSQIELADLYGKSIMISPLHQLGEGPGVGAGTLELNISHLPAGIYFIRINLENQTIVKKIIKQ